MVQVLLMFVVLATAYGVLYYFNHRTPVPEGCEHLKADCEGCKIHSCGNNPIFDRSKGENV